MGQGLGTGSRSGYASELAGLWSGLSETLGRLETLAADPDETLATEEAPTALPQLQYALHAAGEAAAGIDPPAGAEASHAELAGALCDARDATAEVADALIAGGVDAAWPLVYEWRGALFRVRLARLRLAPKPAAPPPRPRHSRPALAVVLAAAAIVAAALSALLELWPIAAAALAIAAFAVIRIKAPARGGRASSRSG